MSGLSNSDMTIMTKSQSRKKREKDEMKQEQLAQHTAKLNSFKGSATEIALEDYKHFKTVHALIMSGIWLLLSWIYIYVVFVYPKLPKDAWI
jgi:hypothetical protein